MEFCPKIFKTTSRDGLNLGPGIGYDWADVQKMESCCNSILQCDAQKRAELNSTLIEEDIHHCDCENKYRECLSKSNLFDVIEFGEDYFMKTAKCYSIDYPIIKCKQYKCYYQPKETYNQYPSGYVDGAVRFVEYELDKNKPKIYKTFELPFYYDNYDAEDYKWLSYMARNVRDG